MRWLLVVMVVGACAKAPPPPPKPPPPPPKLTPLEEAQAVITRAYEAVEHGDGEALEALLTADAMVFGLGPSDTYNFRESFVERASQLFLPLGLGGDTLAVHDSRVTGGLAQGAASGWVYDLPRVELTHGGQTSTWLPRVTAHVLKDERGWRIDALHVSIGVPDALVNAPDAKRNLLAPAPVADDRGEHSEELVGLTRRLIDDMGVKVDRASEGPAFVLIGTSPVELFEGGAAFKSLVRPQLSAIKKGGYSWKLDGPLRTRVAPDGQTGWAAGVLVLRIGTGKHAQVLPPFRALWVFAQQGGVWNLVSEHQSLAVKEDLRAPADEEQLKAWRAMREVAAKRKAPADAGVKEGSDIGVW